MGTGTIPYFQFDDLESLNDELKERRIGAVPSVGSTFDTEPLSALSEICECGIYLPFDEDGLAIPPMHIDKLMHTGTFTWYSPEDVALLNENTRTKGPGVGNAWECMKDGRVVPKTIKLPEKELYDSKYDDILVAWNEAEAMTPFVGIFPLAFTGTLHVKHVQRYVDMSFELAFRFNTDKSVSSGGIGDIVFVCAALKLFPPAYFEEGHFVPAMQEYDLDEMLELKPFLWNEWKDVRFYNIKKLLLKREETVVPTKKVRIDWLGYRESGRRNLRALRRAPGAWMGCSGGRGAERGDCACTLAREGGGAREEEEGKEEANSQTSADADRHSS